MRRVLAETMAEAEGQGVTLAGQVYHSPLALTDWVSKNRAETLPLEIWSDCISMFEQLTMVSMTSESRSTAQTKHKKADHESVEMGLLINSFGTTVPAVFQKGGTASGAIQKVAVAESFEEWDCGDRQSGVVDGIEDLSDAWDTSMTSTIDSLQVQFGEQKNIEC